MNEEDEGSFGLAPIHNKRTYMRLDSFSSAAGPVFEAKLLLLYLSRGTIVSRTKQCY